MKKVIKEIFDKIEDNDALSLESVAKMLNVSTRQLNYYREGTRELTFGSLVKLAQIVYPENTHEKISQWCLRFSTTDTISNAFAYAMIKRDTPLLARLLDEHRGTTGKIEQCVTVYDFVLRFMQRNINKFNMSDELNNLKYVKNASLLLLIDIYRVIATYHQQEFLTIPNKADELIVRISEMSDKTQGFLKECYLHLVSEILALTYMHLNDTARARHFARIVIHSDANPRSTADAYTALGMSYISENETKCLEYMTLAYEFSRRTGDANVERDGLYNLHHAQLMLGHDVPDDAEPALIYFAKFRKGQATKEKVEEVIRESGDESLIAMFEGMAEGTEGMYEKYHELVAEANMLYAALMVTEIIRAGDDSAFVRSLAKMCLAKKSKLKGDDLFEETYIRSFRKFNSSGVANCA